MKTLLALSLLLVCSVAKAEITFNYGPSASTLGRVAAASRYPRQDLVPVRPYVRSNGTYVNGHYRTMPDGNPYNNLGFQRQLMQQQAEFMQGAAMLNAMQAQLMHQQAISNIVQQQQIRQGSPNAPAKFTSKERRQLRALGVKGFIPVR